MKDMAAPQIFASFAKFILETFGDRILAVTWDKLTSFAQRLFADSNILIFGAKSTGKSCLVSFLTEGKPYTVNKEGDKVTPAPTAMGALLNNKIAPDKTGWYKLKQDFPGEPDLRHTWKQGIEDFDPSGIVYMMNGQMMVNDVGVVKQSVEENVEEMFRDVLTCYSGNLRSLKALCICVNYKDLWSHSPNIEKMLIRDVRSAIETRQDSNNIFVPLKTSIHATQLSKDRKDWNEMKIAMAHFGADLMRK